MNADGTGKLQIDTFSRYLEAFLFGWEFDWSPDSKTIVYTKYEETDTSSIWAINIETTKKKELAQRAMFPSWSPDGAKIVYASLGISEQALDLWVVNADGSNKRKLTSNALFPSWSPDGTKIVYMNGTEDQMASADIWIINVAGTNNIKLASNATLPKWLSLIHI